MKMSGGQEKRDEVGILRNIDKKNVNGRQLMRRPYEIAQRMRVASCEKAITKTANKMCKEL